MRLVRSSVTSRLDLNQLSCRGGRLSTLLAAVHSAPRGRCVARPSPTSDGQLPGSCSGENNPIGLPRGQHQTRQTRSPSFLSMFSLCGQCGKEYPSKLSIIVSSHVLINSDDMQLRAAIYGLSNLNVNPRIRPSTARCHCSSSTLGGFTSCSLEMHLAAEE